MKLFTKGLVIKEQIIGESDRLVTLLTADYGILKAFAHRAKQTKSKLNSSTTLFAYSDFVLRESKNSYVVEDATSVEIFFDLRKDIERLTLAQYFVQLAFELSAEGQPEEELLNLTLNSLYLLCNNKKDQLLVKSVYELRSVCIGGYMPNIIACDECGTYETDIMYFDIVEGKIYCDKCGASKGIMVTKSIIKAIRFICLSEPQKVFSFTLDDDNLKLLNDITERYTINCIERKLTALDFYKSLLAN